MSVKPIPDGYHSITPYLLIKGAAKAIDFYAKAFGAQEKMRLVGPDGRIGHAELKIGDSHIMLADEHPEMDAFAPETPGRSGVGILLYVENVDEVVERAVTAGAEIERPLYDQFYGDRSATLLDPFGHMWTVATHIEDVTPEEIQQRMEAMMSGDAPE
ncbi:Glyoxalase-like domain protein [Maioricimonas rarisocia]|uniref:Glyoxalase-like domain protein n=1 Tax=Maioricimonas rarisocia TaxID=2528026 RepID=A0A517ZA76_9PLAN|nr:VOC family protein [Maioricimonas rarisocia]QDU39392.1 Glyoxalase-like domain protein [Maioricimonas rarisocia]